MAYADYSYLLESFGGATLPGADISKIYRSTSKMVIG